MNNDITNARVRELASSDGHLIIDGGVVQSVSGSTVYIKGEDWTLAIEESAIQSSPYGYLLPEQTEAEPIAMTDEELRRERLNREAPAFELTPDKPKRKYKKRKSKGKKRKPQAKTTPGRIMEVKQLKANGEKVKAITARTGLSSSSIAKIMRGELDYKLTEVQRAIIYSGNTTKTKHTNRTRRYRNVPEELVLKIEAYLEQNNMAKQGEVMEKFDISSGTYWRILNGKHTVQLRRNK